MPFLHKVMVATLILEFVMGFGVGWTLGRRK